MANKSYFSYIPDFDYVGRLPKAQSISEYIRVKNLFKRTKIAETIFNDITYFTKYQIIGDERPDNIAYKIYGNSNLDWIIMLSNNVTNLQSEWPLETNAFYKFLINKYGSEAKLQDVHHYETQEVKSSTDKIIVPKGLEVNEDFSVTYYDPGFGGERVATSITGPVTNQEYEEKIQDEKRNISVIKPKFLGLIIEEMKKVMKYKPGSTQYVSPTVVKGENIRIYE